MPEGIHSFIEKHTSVTMKIKIGISNEGSIFEGVSLCTSGSALTVIFDIAPCDYLEYDQAGKPVE